MMAERLSPFTKYFKNWISLAGGVIATGSIFAFLLLFVIDLAAKTDNPYLGILAYIIAPGFFFLGTGLAGIGWILERRKQAKGSGLSFHIDLSHRRDRRRMAYFGAGAFFFILLTSIGSYETYHYTESVQFCGVLCHTPMDPQYQAYWRSPHSRIACVECHVGSGATWYMKAKMAGVKKVYLTLLDSYDTPIKSKAEHMRGAEATCQECHSPDEYFGSVLKNYDHYLSDDENTYVGLSLMLNTGGGDPEKGPLGIHWHTSAGNKVEFVTRPDEFYGEVIPWVRATRSDGTTSEYRVEDFTDEPDPNSIQTMDCLDCHNRPAHRFTAPNDAIEFAMRNGKLDTKLSRLKFVAAEAMSGEYSSKEEADEGIAAAIKAAYGEDRDLEKTIATLREIYSESFFPSVNASWADYPDNTGHKDSLGCFRCHDDLHTSAADNRVIPAENCTTCHVVLAQGSAEEMNNVAWAGHEYIHPDGGYLGLSCADCHTGAIQEE